VSVEWSYIHSWTVFHDISITELVCLNLCVKFKSENMNVLIKPCEFIKLAFNRTRYTGIVES